MKTFTVATALVLASFSIELFGQEKHGFTNEFLKDSEGNILKDPYKSQMDWVNGLFPEKHKEGYKVSKNDS